MQVKIPGRCMGQVHVQYYIVVRTVCTMASMYVAGYVIEAGGGRTPNGARRACWKTINCTYHHSISGQLHTCACTQNTTRVRSGSKSHACRYILLKWSLDSDSDGPGRGLPPISQRSTTPQTDGWPGTEVWVVICACSASIRPGQENQQHPIPTSEGMRRAHCRLTMARWSSVLLWTSRDTGPI